MNTIVRLLFFLSLLTFAGTASAGFIHAGNGDAPDGSTWLYDWLAENSAQIVKRGAKKPGTDNIYYYFDQFDSLVGEGRYGSPYAVNFYPGSTPDPVSFADIAIDFTSSSWRLASDTGRRVRDIAVPTYCVPSFNTENNELSYNQRTGKRLRSILDSEAQLDAGALIPGSGLCPATTTLAHVPEPDSLALFCLILVGLEIHRRYLFIGTLAGSNS